MTNMFLIEENDKSCKKENRGSKIKDKEKNLENDDSARNDLGSSDRSQSES